jgi:biopolymer transport protein ExbB/TolQ
MPETSNSFLIDYFVQFLFQDWFASIPIAICAIITLTVAINRAAYYSRNKRDLGSFIRRIQNDLEQNNVDNAINQSKQLGGLIGLMTEEALRLTKNHARNFANAFDISASLYIKDLESKLPILSTVGATAPFLGLFGTVVGVIVTLKLLGEQGGQSQAVVIGVAKALIATGFGLIVAIAAVILNNYFNTVVRGFENDFQIIKLTILDYLNSSNPALENDEHANLNAANAQYYVNNAPQGNNPQNNKKAPHVTQGQAIHGRINANHLQQEQGFNTQEYF